LDGALKEFDLYMDPQDWADAEPVPDWNEKPANCMPRTVFSGTQVSPPRCDHFIDMLALTQWPLFEEYGEEFLTDLFTYENMNAKVTAWAEQITAAVEEDPQLDVAEFKSQVEWFQTVLKDAVSDFKAHLDEGLIEEEIVVIEEPDETLFTMATEAGGLRADTINNFEVDAGTESPYADYLFGFASDDSTYAYQWNTTAPASGIADLQFTMNFTAVEGEWTEWGGFIYTSDAPLDLTPYTRLWITASANKEARFRVELRSDTYADYGDIYEMFSNEFQITTEPKLYHFDLKDFPYPQWAKNEWAEGDGWAGDDSEVLDLVLANVRGLGFQMFPTWDSGGIMTQDTEEIIVHVDNIYFE
jgi:hypothetical protein